MDSGENQGSNRLPAPAGADEALGSTWNIVDLYDSYDKLYYMDINEECRLRRNCRSYLNVYLRRGLVKKLPCEKCGAEEVQAHHSDYSKPLQVIWLCRPCHLAYHAANGYQQGATKIKEKRKPVPSKLVSLRLPQDVLDWLAEFRKTDGLKRSAAILRVLRNAMAVKLKMHSPEVEQVTPEVGQPYRRVSVNDGLNLAAKLSGYPERAERQRKAYRAGIQANAKPLSKSDRLKLLREHSTA